MEPQIKIGQEWYFYSNSTTYVIYKIELNEYRYFDGEVLQYDTTIYLHGSNNSTVTKRPEDFVENNCKLIKDSTGNIPNNVTIIPVPTRKRLDAVE